jgi:hypothetical protein
VTKSFLQKLIIFTLALLPFYTLISVVLGRISATLSIHIVVTICLVVVLMSLVLIVVLQYRLDIYRQISSRYILKALIAYGLLLIATLLLSDRSLGAYASFFHYITPFLVIGTVIVLRANSVVDQDYFVRILKVLISCYLIVAVFAILQYYILPRDVLDLIGYSEAGIRSYQLVGTQQQALRVLSTTAGPNSLGIYAAFMIPILVLSKRVITTGIFSKITTILILLTPLVVFVSKSRTGLVGLVFAAFCVLLMHRRQIHKKLKNNSTYNLFVAVVAVLILSPLCLIYINNGFGLSRGGSGIDTSDGQRLRSWELAVDQLQNKPFGHGLGTAGIGSFYRPDGPNIIENYYLQVGYELGIAGLLLFLVATALIFREVVRIGDRYIKYCALNLLGVVVISCIFLPALSDELLATIPFLILGLMVGANLGLLHAESTKVSKVFW